MYKYTLPNSTLCEEQKLFYEENGFLVIQNLIENKLLNECRQRFVDIAEGRVPTSGITVIKDTAMARTRAKGEYLINKIQDFVWDDVLAKYCMDESLLKFVEAFVGPNITAVETVFSNTSPNSKSNRTIYPLHQDLHHFPFRPEGRIVSSWTTFEYANKENGCFYVVPGSHKGNLLAHGCINERTSTYCVEGRDRYRPIYIEMEKGDTVFFHSLLLHGTSPNFTKSFRKAISCTYVDSSCHLINWNGNSKGSNVKKDQELTQEVFRIETAPEVIYDGVTRSKVSKAIEPRIMFLSGN